MSDGGGEVLEGGGANRGSVVRIGNRVHRPRQKGADVAEALLVHLESVGFEGSPRFLGHDDDGRQVLSFLEGDVHADFKAPWIDDDVANARALGRLAAFLRTSTSPRKGSSRPTVPSPFGRSPFPAPCGITPTSTTATRCISRRGRSD